MSQQDAKEAKKATSAYEYFSDHMEASATQEMGYFGSQGVAGDYSPLKEMEQSRDKDNLEHIGYSFYPGKKYQYENNKAFMAGIIDMNRPMMLVSPLKFFTDADRPTTSGTLSEILWLLDNGYTWKEIDWRKKDPERAKYFDHCYFTASGKPLQTKNAQILFIPPNPLKENRIMKDYGLDGRGSDAPADGDLRKLARDKLNVTRYVPPKPVKPAQPKLPSSFQGWGKPPLSSVASGSGLAASAASTSSSVSMAAPSSSSSAVTPAAVPSLLQQLAKPAPARTSPLRGWEKSLPGATPSPKVVSSSPALSSSSSVQASSSSSVTPAAAASMSQLLTSAAPNNNRRASVSLTSGSSSQQPDDSEEGEQLTQGMKKLDF